MEPDLDVYDYRFLGTMLWAPPFLLLLIAFVGTFVYNAQFGELTFNEHPATPSERMFTTVLVPLMASPFIYVLIQGMLRHLNERIVWKDGQISWWDSMGRERVRCSEDAITGGKRVPLLVNGLIRYEIETTEGNVAFLSTMKRAAELRMRLSTHLATTDPAQPPPPPADRRWLGAVAYDYRTPVNLIYGVGALAFA